MSRNNVRISGTGSQPMMFAHGFGCDQNMWRFVAPAFERTHRVVLFDHVGAGGSDLSAYSKSKHAKLEAYADDVLEICREVDLEDVVFVGHSVSSMIGILAAVREPERFAKLVLVGPSPRYIDDEDYIGGFKRGPPSNKRSTCASCDPHPRRCSGSPSRSWTSHGSKPGRWSSPARRSTRASSFATSPTRSSARRSRRD